MAPEPPVRIDTIGFAAPIDHEVDLAGTTAQVRNYGMPDESRRFSRVLPGGGFLATGVNGKAWMEASLPKRADPENRNDVGLGLVDAMVAARELYAEAARYVTFVDQPFDDSGLTHPFQRGGGRFEDCRVVRVDLVRDFHGVARKQELLDGLAAVHQSGRTKVHRHADGERNNAETLTIGPKAWWSTLYDKHAETRGAAPDGQVRFEARCRAELLASVGARHHGGTVHVVADLEEAKLAGLRRWMFHRVGYHRTVSGLGHAAATVWAVDDLPQRRRREILAYLAGRAAGIDLGYDRHNVAVYERVLERLGVSTAGPDLRLGSTAVRLDYDAGVEVVEAA
jgi:hypothetical protein